MRRLVRVTCAAVCVMASVGAQQKPPASSPATTGPSPAFTQIFEQYRRGNPATAIGSFARWKDDRVVAEARLPAGGDDTASLKALALFHTEAGIANGRFGMFAPKTPTFISLGGWGLEDVFEVHSRTAYRIVETLIKRAKDTHDDPLLKFCRNWYIVAMSSCAHGGEATKDDDMTALLKPTLAAPGAPAEEVMQSGGGGRSDCVLGLRDKAMHYFDDDPEMQLTLGSISEPKEMTRAQIALKERALNKSVDAGYGQEARWYFKKAYEADPSLLEAKLRRAHSLHIVLNDPDAQPMLEQVLEEARAADNTFIAHMAAFSLGQVHEDHGELEDAIRYYREAVTLIRAHTASIALGQALIRTGQSEQGWLVGLRMFGREGTGAAPVPDPFVLYKFAQYWQLDDRLNVLRDDVRTVR